MLDLPIDFVLRILAAAGLGALIGLERDIHGRAAGLRTHLLVSAGAATFTVLSEIVARDLNADGRLIADPGRIAAQIISGIGFLGAGAIIKDGFAVRGLTTAACLWIAAAIGMACGTQQYAIAVAVTILALACLILLKMLERLLNHDSYRVLTVVTENDIEIAEIVSAVQRDSVKVSQVGFDRDYATGHTTTRLSLRLRHCGLTNVLAYETVQSLEQAHIPIRRVKWESRS